MPELKLCIKVEIRTQHVYEPYLLSKLMPGAPFFLPHCAPPCVLPPHPCSLYTLFRAEHKQSKQEMLLKVYRRADMDDTHFQDVSKEVCKGGALGMIKWKLCIHCKYCLQLKRPCSMCCL